MSEIADPTGCPSFDEISAYIDGECSAKHTAHIELCAECRVVVQSLRDVDAAVGKVCEVPEGLARRVLHACSQDHSGLSVPTPFAGRLLLRYAAALVLTAGLAIAVRTAVGRSGQEGLSTENAVVNVVPMPEPQLEGSGTLALPAIRDRNLVPVTASTKIGSAHRGPATGRRVLAERVEHVWSVPSIGQVEPWLAGELAKGAWTVADRDKDTLKVDLGVSDTRLQKLVQGMYDKGWHLVSNDLPQPNEQRQVKFDGRAVAYRADFVNAGAAQ